MQKQAVKKFQRALHKKLTADGLLEHVPALYVENHMHDDLKRAKFWRQLICVGDEWPPETFILLLDDIVMNSVKTKVRNERSDLSSALKKSFALSLSISQISQPATRGRQFNYSELYKSGSRENIPADVQTFLSTLDQSRNGRGAPEPESRAAKELIVKAVRQALGRPFAARFDDNIGERLDRSARYMFAFGTVVYTRWLKGKQLGKSDSRDWIQNVAHSMLKEDERNKWLVAIQNTKSDAPAVPPMSVNVDCSAEESEYATSPLLKNTPPPISSSQSSPLSSPYQSTLGTRRAHGKMTNVAPPPKKKEIRVNFLLFFIQRIEAALD